MGKLGYFFTTLVGAVPAGFGLYLMIAEVFLKRTEELTTMLLVITITATVCMALVALTPFMVLVFYKDTRPKLAAAGAGAAAAGAAAAASRGDEAEGFGDAIPDDFDEEELAASAGEDYGDEYADDEYADDDADYEDDFEDLDL